MRHSRHQIGKLRGSLREDAPVPLRTLDQRYALTRGLQWPRQIETGLSFHNSQNGFSVGGGGTHWLFA
jgi:hypothetical protein